MDLEKPAQADMLNLRHLRAFQAVAQTENISAAAKVVFLSQPAITQAIAKLEMRLGVKLFDRRPSGMYLSDAGRMFRIRVDRALARIDAGAQEALKRSKVKLRGFRNFELLLTSVQLRALIAVAKTGNFSLAARSIGASQPSLHRAARDLEKLSGVALYERASQGIVLTRSAEVFQRQVQLAFSELDQGIEEIGNYLGADVGEITIGTMPLARSFVLPRALTLFTTARPDVKVRVVEGPYGGLLRGLRYGETDLLIGALRADLPVDDVVQEVLFSDPLAVVARAGHPLAQRDGISVTDLAEHSWVIPRSETPTRTYFDQLFDRHRVEPPNRIIEAGSLILIRGLLADSDRLTVMSAHQMRREEETGVLIRLNFDLSDTVRDIGLTTRRDWHPTLSQSLFMDHLRAVTAAIPSGGYSKNE